ncbi:SusC/RagA family TonB-linked outer membrane protein [Bacteroides congonensis]|uniref:SusC/RagA family TonB-linked outer membrane protein n=1 Tax=Bacteroides congonensis TaxID=1871006 RepID=UPI00189EC9E0|nr:SusC/RagA family TonB-linked outer membrane protein [Bacteroides congonensis]
MNLYLKTAKSTIIICCLFILQTTAFAQSNIRITIKKTEITLQNALVEVERQSKLSVAYNQSQLSGQRQLSLNIVNQPLESALKTILKGTGFSYKLTDKYIMVVPEKKETNSQASKTVKGKIVDENGEPLIGVNVAVDGTTTGTITDFDGNFSMSAFANSTLKVSYIGYATQLVAVSDKEFYSITMRPDNEVLDEVVVTALGIKRETKSLTYNVQEMKAADLTTVKDASFMNSLAGKIAGVTINQSASGIGGSTRVVMRGLKSITNDNNALYVIDGIPMSSMRSNQEKSFYENADGGDSDGISSINPDDIESMSVLTGAAAAALYGSQGANGVVLITTKKGEEGKLRINYSNDTQFMSPLVMPEFQTTYGSVEGEFASWGAKKNATWEPKDFFQTGFTETNSIGLSAGNDRNQTYFSAASTNARGIIPNNTYNRYNFTLRNTTELIKDKLTLDMSASYVITNDNNMMSQGQYHNPLVALYLMPRGDDLNKYKVYERYDSEKYYDVQYWPYGNQGMAIENPYWIVNRENMSNHKSRYMFSANLNYKVFEWMNVVGRMRIDNSNDTYERKISASSDQLFASEYGNYMNMKSGYKNTYGDVMAQINKRWENWGITANVGASFNHQMYEMTDYEGHLATVPNFFSFNNISKNGANTKAEQAGYTDNNQAVFATFQLGYKSWAYLDLTARNDWFSTLANTDNEKSGFFYPSVGISAVVSEIVDLSKVYISFLKVRASYSEVGNPPMRQITVPTYAVKDGVVNTSSRLLNPDLKPERTKSVEVGMNLRMFQNLLNIDFTYYNSNTFNQFINYTMPPSTGYSNYMLNGGKVNNWGIEARLGINTNLGPVKWNSNLTFTMNRNKVIYLLPGGATNPITGEPISITEIEPFNPQGSYKMIVKEGGTLSDIYVTGLKRDYQGNVKVNPQTGSVETDPNTWIKAGSTAPRFNWGWNNSFSWKGINLSFLIDARIGGVGVSATQAKMDYYGTSKKSAIVREDGGVPVGGGRLTAEDYYKVAGSGMTGALANYVYSMTNVRLREATLGYTFPTKWFGNQIQNLTVSLIGKNLFMFHNKAPFDPELSASTGTYYQGFDYFMQPSVRSIGFSVKFQY